MDATTGSLVMTNMSDETCDLRFVDVTKRYDDFTLEGVTFGVPRGSVVGLVGRNGAGKTTLMKAAFDVIMLDGGHVEVFGVNPATLAAGEVISLRQRVGFVGAVMSFPVDMTLPEVRHLFELSYPRFDRGAFDDLCVSLGLASFSRTVKDLSRGMGMKLQLACVLASGADLLVLDEPTAGLDPIVRDEALDALGAWMGEGERSLLISSHITSDLERLADYLVMVEEGRMVLSCRRERLDAMGVAHLSDDELARVLADGVIPPGQRRMLRRGALHDLLVPERSVFRARYPELACDRASIDDVVALVARGEVR